MLNDIQNVEHIQEIYSEKAINILKICIGIFIFSFITYMIAIFILSNFDFGFIFEIISFIFTLLTIHKIKSNNYTSARTCIIIAMLPLGWLIIYDLFNLLANIKEVFI